VEDLVDTEESEEPEASESEKIKSLFLDSSGFVGVFLVFSSFFFISMYFRVNGVGLISA